MALRLVPDNDAGDLEVADDVVAAAAAFDDRACRAVLSCYERRVFTLCVRMLGDRRSAEEAAQDTFWKGLRALSTFDPQGPAKLSTWLLTIATRTCLDELRRRRRRDAPLLPFDDAVPAVDDVGAEAVVLAKEEASEGARSIEARLMALPEDQRVVLVWRALLGTSERETAQALGIPAGTVKSRLSRALASLKETRDERA